MILVVFVDDRFHVVHAAITNFNVVLVKELVVLVLFGEVFRNEFEECTSDVGLNIFAVGRVIPDDVSLPVVSGWCGLLLYYLHCTH